LLNVKEIMPASSTHIILFARWIVTAVGSSLECRVTRPVTYFLSGADWFWQQNSDRKRELFANKRQFCN